MLQALRDNLKGTVAIIIVGLMIIPFALFGVDSLFLSDNTAGKAAEVNGEVISEMQLARAVQMQKQQIIQRFGDQAPADLLVDEELRKPVLTRLLRRELLRQAATKGGMTVSETSLDQMIVATPQFQRDGKFSPELFTLLLRNMGYTPASYKKLLVEDILVNQHATAVTASAFATEEDLRQLTELTQQTRSFYYLTLPFESAQSQIRVSEEETRQYYEANPNQFMLPERVAVEYIELSLDQLASETVVDPALVRAQFEQEKANFQPRIERHAAHILIEPSDQADTTIATVKQKLEEGVPFEELAAEYSEDLGSSELGGDLGVTDGTAFPEAFETGLASLEVGKVSDVVETDAGFHFIKLLDETITAAPDFEATRKTIEESLAFAEAESQFVELLEALPDATYNVDSLSVAADQLGLQARVSDYFDRENAVGVLANNQVQAAVFSNEVLEQGLSSEVIDVTPNHVVVVKLKDRKPAELKQYAEVRKEIIDMLTAEKVAELLEARAAELQAQLEAGARLQELAEASELEWQVKAGVMRTDANTDRQLLSHIFALPKPQGKPVNSMLAMQNGDYLVTQLTVVETGKLPDMEESQRSAFKQRLAQEFGNSEMQIYQAALDVRADIEIYD